MKATCRWVNEFNLSKSKRALNSWAERLKCIRGNAAVKSVLRNTSLGTSCKQTGKTRKKPYELNINREPAGFERSSISLEGLFQSSNFANARNIAQWDSLLT